MWKASVVHNGRALILFGEIGTTSSSTPDIKLPKSNELPKTFSVHIK